MDKPAVYPEWATNDLNDPVTVAPNKEEPSDEFKASGLLSAEDFARQYINYQYNILDKWVKNLDTRSSVVGSVHISVESLTLQDMTDRFGGTWVSHGSDTLAGISINVWERVA